MPHQKVFKILIPFILSLSYFDIDHYYYNISSHISYFPFTYLNMIHILPLSCHYIEHYGYISVHPPLPRPLLILLLSHFLVFAFVIVMVSISILNLNT